MEIIFSLSVLAVILAIFYYYLTCNYRFWSKQGIPCAKNTLPILGNLSSVIFMKDTFSALCEKFYNTNQNHSMFGFYQLQTPALLIRDPELVKTVLLTNFSNFADNKYQVTSSKLDRFFAINPFFSRIDTWKENRAPLTSAFSSKKLKLMLPFVQDVTTKLQLYLKRKTNFHQGKWEIELKQFSNMFTGEIAAAGIGFQGHNFQDESETTRSSWEYKKFIDSFFSEAFFTGGLKQVLFQHLPQLANILQLSMVPKYVNDFFQSTVKNILSHRMRENIKSDDYLQIMVDYYKANGAKIEGNDALIGHIVTFAIEIYESSAITMSFLLFQLSAHPEIQDKVREEIRRILDKNNGKLDYEDLKEMTYFEQVLNESMRLNHVIGTFSRRCTNEIRLVGSDGLSCIMKPGHVAVISTYGLQMDGKYWPEPEKFDPERFNKEQSAGRPKFVFVPFGEGPRICVGMRMSIMMIKLATVAVLKNFRLRVSPKTAVPLKKSDGSFMTAFDDGLWVFVEELKQK